MTKAEIRTKLDGVFREVFDDDTISISDAMTAKDIDGWDSINHVNLMVAVEAAFGVRFATREVTTLANVGELVDLLERKLNAR